MTNPVFLPVGTAPPVTDVSARVQSLNASDAKARDLVKLGKAAGEFEAILLNSLWSSMKETFSTGEEGGEDDPILKSFDDWGMQALSGAAGAAGALGIKSMLMKHLGGMLESTPSEPR
jgi:Rod binding domain-containing protein